MTVVAHDQEVVTCTHHPDNLHVEMIIKWTGKWSREEIDPDPLYQLKSPTGRDRPLLNRVLRVILKWRKRKKRKNLKRRKSPNCPGTGVTVTPLLVQEMTMMIQRRRTDAESTGRNRVRRARSTATRRRIVKGTCMDLSNAVTGVEGTSI